MANYDYKAVTITRQTADKVDELKAKFAENGTPIQPPAIIGMAVNEYAEKILGK